jgi:hypothetical protein
MPDLTDVLHRATDDLAPDAPDLLLAGAVRRGAGLRRRRQAVRAAGGSALVAAVVCGVVAIGAQSGGPAREALTDPVSTLSDSPSVTPHTQLAVDRSQIGATFAQVVPGTISDEHDVPAGRVHSRGAYESEFDWNGFRVSVILTPFDGDARHACERTLDRQVTSIRCVRVPGAWVVRDDTMGEQSSNRSANVFRDDGWQAWVLIYNSGDEKGSSSAGAPPLDVADLEKVGTSDLWVG